MAIVNTLKIFEELKSGLDEKQKGFLATKEDLAKEASSLEIKIEQVKSELIKWMFIFWIGQIGVLTAIFGVIFKK